ncbi:MAG TPA: hypothetical protein PKD85_06165 [Saprospiraceae bacterium]|nr:hypothetical protein [Saprospiraceae bacterium]
MRIRHFITFLVAVVMLFASCKENPKRPSKDSKGFKPEMGFVPMEYGQSFDLDKEKKIKAQVGENAKRVKDFVMSPDLLREWQARALSEINAEAQQSNNKAYASFTAKPWIIDGIVVDDFAERSIHEGMWLQFKDDLTYEYGRYSDKLGKGKYYYNADKESLIILDNDLNVKPLEFEVGWDMGFIVIGGTKKYDDDALMIKLINKANIPTK